MPREVNVRLWQALDRTNAIAVLDDETVWSIAHEKVPVLQGELRLLLAAS